MSKNCCLSNKKRGYANFIHGVAELEVFELEGVVPLSLEGPHQLLGHPLDLRLGELHHVVAHVVAQGQRVRQQSGFLVLPQLQGTIQLILKQNDSIMIETKKFNTD